MAGRHLASLRYFANTGGRMPEDTLQVLRSKVPAAKPYLMYGLTEAFRSTPLPPEEVDPTARRVWQVLARAVSGFGKPRRGTLQTLMQQPGQPPGGMAVPG